MRQWTRATADANVTSVANSSGHHSDAAFVPATITIITVATKTCYNAGNDNGKKHGKEYKRQCIFFCACAFLFVISFFVLLFLFFSYDQVLVTNMKAYYHFCTALCCCLLPTNQITQKSVEETHKTLTMASSWNMSFVLTRLCSVFALRIPEWVQQQFGLRNSVWVNVFLTDFFGFCIWEKIVHFLLFRNCNAQNPSSISLKRISKILYLA